MANKTKQKVYEGYRAWFAHDLEYSEESIFILNFEAKTFYQQEEAINGIMIYCKDEQDQKRKVFLRHEPYFYVLLDPLYHKNDYKLAKRVADEILAIDDKIIRVTLEKKIDGEFLQFPKETFFLKVVVDSPYTIHKLRDATGEIDGVLEWREGDVMFHHRVAVDRDINIGFWYDCEMDKGEIISIKKDDKRPPPHLSVLAYDLETPYHPERDPSAENDSILMNILFGDDRAILLVQSKDVDTTDIKDFKIVVRPPDDEHDKPWVDWIPIEDYDRGKAKEYLDERDVKVVKLPDEKALLEATLMLLEDEEFGKPDILVDFFGDHFDMPFLFTRSKIHKVPFAEKTGFSIKYKGTKLRVGNILKDVDYIGGAGIIHLDAFLFNDKYSYLPKKDLGLKQSVEKKLKIIPIGREALKSLKTNPFEAVGYAGCDGYITWRYVREIVLEFYLAMGQMFYVNADEILTKRSGFLDDLMVDARGHRHNIVARKRRTDPASRDEIKYVAPNIKIDSLACTGALVDVRNDGVFRSDLKYDIPIDHDGLDAWQKNIDILLENIIAEEESKGYTFANTSLKHELKQTFEKIKQKNGKQIYLRGIHADVASMYPSVVRMYKLQPAGVVNTMKCMTCPYKEANKGCYQDFNWIVKFAGQRTFQSNGSRQKEQELFALEDGKVVAYRMKRDTLMKVDIKDTFFSGGLSSDPYISMRKWVKEIDDKYDLGTALNEGVFDYFENTDIEYPPNTFMTIDVRTKKAIGYVSVKTRMCQKAYSHVAEIMDTSFQKRMYHKREAQRIYGLMKSGEASEDMIKRQRFHNATQLGMKVPLNSIYGLLAVKQGVRNSCLAGAGITTIESIRIINTASFELEKIGIVGELDTDGIWAWLPLDFPFELKLTFTKGDETKKVTFRVIESVLNKWAQEQFRNDNFWINDGEKIYNSPRALIFFEQDGPYDFQYIMGKKKYIVYNRRKDGWKEEEITGLETKRSDFSKLKKKFQQDIIDVYLSEYGSKRISLRQLYQLAWLKAESIRKSLKAGKIPPSYLVKPKAISGELEDYNQNLPQIRAAKIYRDMGFDVSAGVKIQLIFLAGGLAVPYELFKMKSKKKFKWILKKYQIFPMDVLLGQITSPKDLRRYVDYEHYIEDLFGNGKLFDRMIRKFVK